MKKLLKLQTQVYLNRENDTGKVWVDGKKIYRKSFDQNITLVPSTYLKLDINTIDTVISVTGFSFSFGYGWQPFNRCLPSTEEQLMYSNSIGDIKAINGGKIFFLFGSEWKGDTRIVLTIEYTKV